VSYVRYTKQAQRSKLLSSRSKFYSLFGSVTRFRYWWQARCYGKTLCESDDLEIFVGICEYSEENWYVLEEIQSHDLTNLTKLANFKNGFPEINFQQHEWKWNTSAVTTDENTSKQTPRPESASELYRPSDHRLSAKLVLTFADKGCRVVSAAEPLRQ
jgi:hypothetical protein